MIIEYILRFLEHFVYRIIGIFLEFFTKTWVVTGNDWFWFGVFITFYQFFGGFDPNLFPT